MKKTIMAGIMAAYILASTSCSSPSSRRHNQNQMNTQKTPTEVMENNIQNEDTVAKIVKEKIEEIKTLPIEEYQYKTYDKDSNLVSLSETYNPNNSTKSRYLTISSKEKGQYGDPKTIYVFNDENMDLSLFEKGTKDFFIESVNGLGEGSWMKEYISSNKYLREDSATHSLSVDLEKESTPENIWEEVQKRQEFVDSAYNAEMDKFEKYIQAEFDRTEKEISSSMTLDENQLSERNIVNYKIDEINYLRITDGDSSGYIGDSPKDLFEIYSMGEGGTYTRISLDRSFVNPNLSIASIAQEKSEKFLTTIANDYFRKGQEQRERKLIEIINNGN